MRKLAPASLLGALLGCAAPPAVPAGHESETGPHRLRLALAEWQEPAEPGGPPLLALQCDFTPGDEGTLISRRPIRVEVATADGARVSTRDALHRTLGRDTTLVVRGVRTGVLAGTLPEVVLEVTLVRVESWAERERPGLMDASLDEEEWPPFHLRFAGEGESFWLSASLATAPGELTKEAAALAEHLTFEYVTERATVRDAKGRDLVHFATAGQGGGAVASYAVNAPGGPVPENPTIEYPAAVRLRLPEKWRAETARFVLKDVPLPPRKDGGP